MLADVKTIMQWRSRFGGFWRQEMVRRSPTTTVPSPVTLSGSPASTSEAPTTGL